MDNIITETILPISNEQLEGLKIIKPSKDNDIAIVFDNFLRDELTFNLIKSIFKFYSGVKLYISDQSVYNKNTFSLYEKLIKNSHDVIFCGFDCGISNARNRAIEKVKEKYVFMCDCDNLFNEQTNLEDLKIVLENNPNVGLISLYEKENNEINHYEHNLERCGDVLYYHSIKPEDSCRLNNYFLCDYTMNVGLAKKEMFDIVKYDCNLKLAEHLDFFMSIKYKSTWKVACSTVVQIENQNVEINNEQYNKFRNRNKIYWAIYKDKWNLKQINDYLLNQEDYVNPKITEIKKETTRKEEQYINFFTELNQHEIEYWLLKHSCLECIIHKEFKTDLLSLGICNINNKNKIIQIAKRNKIPIEITVEHRKVKSYSLYGINIFVPVPVVTYLTKLYGTDWMNKQ